MKDSLELLLEDIYALDPSLRERDLEVRALVQSLLLNKPKVDIDVDFANKLRAKLLTPKVSKNELQTSIPSLWMRYFAPIGAIAILILMLVPNYVGKPVGVEESIVPVDSYDTFMAPEAKRSGGAPEEASMMITDDGEAEVFNYSDSIVINDQEPGVVALVDVVSLMSPGFVVISRSNNGMPGEVLGSSHLLFAEENYQVEIPLVDVMKFRQTFTAQLYYDDGDGVFDINLDQPVFDNYGNLIYQIFTINP